MRITAKQFVQLPTELEERAIPLVSIGLSEHAWRADDALCVIDALVEKKYIMLGGDVYRIIGDIIEPLSDGWYIEKDINESQDELILRAAKKARDYVTMYSKLGDEYAYVIVCTLEM